MTASKIDVIFLHCDQGMGTLVRIYDASDRLAHLALLDLGSESGTKKYSDSAINYVLRALKQMEADKLQPKIDLLLISHQDFDHWSLLPNLLEKIQSEIPACQVDDIYYGGTKWRKKASEAVAEWEDEFGVTAEAFSKGETNFSKPGKAGTVKVIDGVNFHLLCANVPVSRAAQDLERNGTSAVIAIHFGGVNVIIPGDATADTCGWINDNVFAPWKKAGKGNPVSPCRAMGAPHHGALRTIASNFVSTTRAKLEIATTFANNVSAENVVASAGWYSKFNHPYKAVMELLAVNAQTDQLKHDFVWYDGSEKVWEQVAKSKRGIFTTITTLTDPPTRTGWSFTITAKGEILFFIDLEQAETIPAYERSNRYGATPRQR
ncbi:MAG: MBL fold metallo-hydrolase [Pyrinomonadaceae bacterium]